MKKCITLLQALALTMMLFIGSTQKSNAQAMEQGNVGVNVYYGFPNLASYLIRSFADEGADAKLTSIGPIGGNFEYMASDKVGVGLEVNYSSFGIEWDDADSASDVVYNYKASVNRTRIMPRFNIHFGASENFTGYFGIAAGYLMTKYKLTTNDPNRQNESSPGLLPFAMRIAFGGRYYFSDNIGIHMELVLGGGALIHAGLSFKF